MASNKQWPALPPAPTCSRSPTIPNSNQQLPVPSPTFNHFTSLAYYGAVTKEPHHTPIYLLVIILTLTDKFTNLMCQQHYQDTSHHRQYMHRGIQTNIITPLWRNKLELEHFNHLFIKSGHYKTTTTIFLSPTIYFNHYQTIYCTTCDLIKHFSHFSLKLVITRPPWHNLSFTVYFHLYRTIHCTICNVMKTVIKHFSHFSWKFVITRPPQLQFIYTSL